MKRLYFIIFLTSLVRFVTAQTECTVDLRVGSGATSDNPVTDAVLNQMRVTRTVCQLHGLYDNYVQAPVNAIGSRTDKKVDDPTGFFHVRKIDGRWWVIDPEGYYFIHKGVTSIRPGSTLLQTENFRKKWGSNTGAWVEDVKTMLKKYDFTGIGGFCDENNFNTYATEPMPYTMICNFMSSYRTYRRNNLQKYTGAYAGSNSGQSVYVFDPEWETFCLSHAQNYAKYANDKNCFGFLSDNELYFQTNNTNMLQEYLQFPDGDPNKDSTALWLRNRLSLAESAPLPAYGSISADVRNEFLYYAGKRYYRFVSEALKKHCPNHMYLGSRNFTAERTNEWFMKAQNGYVNIMSVNYYGVWTPDMGQLHNWERWTDAPLIVTEFYVKAMDSGLPNTGGAGWAVRTQTDRGLYYQNYTLALLQSKTCVGWHWFRYQDNDVTIPREDNDDANKGVVDNNFDPWIEALEYMKEINSKVYNIIDYFDNPDKPEEEGDIIYPEADAYFNVASNGETNYGTATEMLIKNYPNTGHREAYIRFDLNSIEEQVSSAKIILTKTVNKTVKRPYEASVVNDNSWSENEIKYSNAPKTGTVIRTWNEPAGYDTLTLDVTSFVIAALASSDRKISIRIQSLDLEGGTETVLRFASREHPDIAVRPRLMLNDKELPDDGVLKAIVVNDYYLEGFGGNKSAYTYQLPNLSKLPVVKALAINSKSLIEITQAVNLTSSNIADRTATVKITSSTDATKTSTYSVTFEQGTLPTPTGLRVDNNTITSIATTWNRVDEAFKYKFYLYDTNNSPVAAYNGIDVPQNFLTASGLPDGESFSFKVQSIRGNFSSALSEACSASTKSFKTEAVNPVSITGTSFIARWRKIKDATGYHFHAYNSRDELLSNYSSLATTDTFMLVTGLSQGEKYSYNVKTVIGTNVSGFSNTVVLNTQIGTPVAIQAAPVSSNSFTANWNQLSGAEGYKLTVTDASGNPLANYNGIVVAATLKEVTGLSPGTVYKYTIKAYKGDYESPSSNEITVTTLVATDTKNPAKSDCKIYPNPGSGLFTFEGNFPYNTPLKVISANGSVILSTNITALPFVIDLREQPTGTYLVVVEDEQNRKIYKIVKN